MDFCAITPAIIIEMTLFTVCIFLRALFFPRYLCQEICLYGFPPQMLASILQLAVALSVPGKKKKRGMFSMGLITRKRDKLKSISRETNDENT